MSAGNKPNMFINTWTNVAPHPEVVMYICDVGFSPDSPENIISWQTETNDTYFGIVSVMPSTK